MRGPVSYTHLDVYKRQHVYIIISCINFNCFSDCKLMERMVVTAGEWNNKSSHI